MDNIILSEMQKRMIIWNSGTLMYCK